MKAMLKFTALLAFSFAVFGVAAAGGAGDGKLDACDSAVLQHVRDPLARILDHLTPSERLLAELDNETNVDPYAFVNNNPVQVNMVLMSVSLVPTPTMSGAMETATDGTDEEDEGDIVEDEPGHVAEEAPITHGQCSLHGRTCNARQCMSSGGIVMCYMGMDGKCHKVVGIVNTPACRGCYCTRDGPSFPP